MHGGPPFKQPPFVSQGGQTLPQVVSHPTQSPNLAEESLSTCSQAESVSYKQLKGSKAASLDKPGYRKLLTFIHFDQQKKVSTQHKSSNEQELEVTVIPQEAMPFSKKIFIPQNLIGKKTKMNISFQATRSTKPTTQTRASPRISTPLSKTSFSKTCSFGGQFSVLDSRSSRFTEQRSTVRQY